MLRVYTTVFVGMFLAFSISSNVYSQESFFFGGNSQHLTTTLVNPYTGETIEIDEVINANINSYNGTVGNDDNLFFTGLGDALFIRDSLSNQIVSNIEIFFAGQGGDILALADDTFILEDTYIFGGSHNDIIWANIGNDQIFGENGNDIINGGPGNDIIEGNGDNDKLRGAGGDDTLDGGDGNDILIADLGLDELTGGTGSDLFIVPHVQNLFFNTGTLISDFNANEGDVLDISGMIPGYDPNTDLLTDFVSFHKRAGTTDFADVFVNQHGSGGRIGIPTLSIIGLQSTAGMEFGSGTSEAQLQQLVSGGLLVVDNIVPEPASVGLLLLGTLLLITQGSRDTYK